MWQTTTKNCLYWNEIGGTPEACVPTSCSDLFAAALRYCEGYAVAFDLCIECGVLDAEKSGRARLIAAGSHQGRANEIRFELPHFVVKLHFVIAVVRCGASQAIDDIEEFHGDIAKRSKPAFKCVIAQKVDGLT